jgi:hypothetical protein
VDFISYRHHFSSGILLRMILVAVATLAILASQYELVKSVYFNDQVTQLKLIINGGVLALFLFGLAKMVMNLSLYAAEERAIARFLRNQDKADSDPLRGIAKSSIIARRYLALEHLHQSNTPIAQNALAATLIASESTRSSLPKFVNNVLILTGVFGTVLSLSIALLGASDVLNDPGSTDGMGMVVHGMTTALSTTITAILCYFFFGYFYLKLTDAQTNLVSAVEQITTAYLIPKFQVQTDSVLYEFTGLIRSLQSLVGQMDNSQKALLDVEHRMLDAAEGYRARVGALDEDMARITRILRRGFRLREDI